MHANFAKRYMINMKYVQKISGVCTSFCHFRIFLLWKSIDRF